MRKIETRIISGFPGVGKSEFFKNVKDLIVLDSDSSLFSWIKDSEGNNTKERDPEFPMNYMKHIKDNIGKADIILVSSHTNIREALKDNGIQYYLVYPSHPLKAEYLKRYADRGSDEKFIQFIDEHWHDFINEIELDTFPFNIKLWNHQYLGDLFKGIPVCRAYHELCSVKETNADEYPTICHNCTDSLDLI